MCTVIAQLQGIHSFTPPETDLRVTVMEWLNNLHEPDDNTTFELQINCCHIARPGSFYGVRVMGMSDFCSNCVKLHVRPKRSTSFWPCWLVCPNDKWARRICNAARPVELV